MFSPETHNARSQEIKKRIKTLQFKPFSLQHNDARISQEKKERERRTSRQIPGSNEKKTLIVCTQQLTQVTAHPLHGHHLQWPWLLQLPAHVPQVQAKVVGRGRPERPAACEGGSACAGTKLCQV